MAGLSNFGKKRQTSSGGLTAKSTRSTKRKHNGTMPSFISELNADLEEGLVHKSLPELQVRHEKLRVSGFPYCGLRHFYRRMVERVNGQAPMEFGKAFYTSVGTAAHLALQRFMGQTGRLFGNWKCYNCAHMTMLSHVKTCPKCGSEMEYEELEVHAFKHLSGHVDGVWQSKETGKYFVIDYKTSSVAAIKKQRKTPTFPYLTNKAQIKAYCALVENNFGIKIDGWMLIYVARDNPRKVWKVVGDLITDREKKRLMNMMEQYDRHYEIATTSRKWIQIKPLFDEKPCKTFEDYENNYESIEGCPLKMICFNPNQLQKTVKDVWLEYKELPNGKAQNSGQEQEKLDAAALKRIAKAEANRALKHLDRADDYE